VHARLLQEAPIKGTTKVERLSFETVKKFESWCRGFVPGKIFTTRKVRD
jgi:hypothetical protein